MKNILLLTFIVFSPLVSAETWNCKNRNMEVTCSDGECAVSDAFTPMDVAFNDSGDLLVCAYSGCWEGEGEIYRSGNFLGIFGKQLSFSTDPDPDRKQDVALLLDMTDNVALLKAGVYAQPLICRTIEETLQD